VGAGRETVGFAPGRLQRIGNLIFYSITIHKIRPPAISHTGIPATFKEESWLHRSEVDPPAGVPVPVVELTGVEPSTAPPVDALEVAG
jgi:hypothetical protein